MSDQKLNHVLANLKRIVGDQIVEILARESDANEAKQMLAALGAENERLQADNLELLGEIAELQTAVDGAKLHAPVEMPAFIPLDDSDDEGFDHYVDELTEGNFVEMPSDVAP